MKRRRFSARDQEKRLANFRGCCADCGCVIDAASGLEWDHQIPLELTGEDSIENLQPLCKKCHRAKTRGDVVAIAKCRRISQKHRGIKTRKAKVGGSLAEKFKRKLDGTVVPR